MHRIHSGFTVAATVMEGKSDDLRKELQILNNPNDSSLSYFKDSKTTLFASGVILPEQYYHGETLPETFVFATSYFGPLSFHVNDLINTCKDGLYNIFKNCYGFPQSSLVTDEEFAYCLKSNKLPSAFNSRYNCITKEDVQNEKELRAEIEDYIDKVQQSKKIDFNLLSAMQIRTLIQRHIKTRGDKYKWVFTSTRKNLIEWLSVNRVAITWNFIYFGLPAFLIYLAIYHYRLFIWFGAGIIAFVVITTSILIFISFNKNLTAPRPPDSYVRKITATQLHPVLNEMTAAAPLKKGFIRRYFYATVLWLIKFVDRLNVPTVSTIRWVVVNKKKRLVFLSNYANTTDFYVRDFLNDVKTSNGINFIFSNGMGFPDAMLGFLGGIRKDPEGYMNAIHADQFVTDFWYTHEPNLTVDVVNKNRAIRNGLFKPMNEFKAKEWLKLL